MNWQSRIHINEAVGSSGIILSDEEMAFIEKYEECFATEGAKRAALIYLDEDSIPELLILKDGGDHPYTLIAQRERR